ncbi:MAG: hypothetical protein AAGL66_15790, partial [Pseudomonadota bacterium]
MPNRIYSRTPTLASNLLSVAAGLSLATAFLIHPAGAQESTQESSESQRLKSTDEFQTSGSELGERSSLPGATLFGKHCASCHYGGVYK